MKEPLNSLGSQEITRPKESHPTHDGRFEIDEEGAGHLLPARRLAEERPEGAGRLGSTRGVLRFCPTNENHSKDPGLLSRGYKGSKLTGFGEYSIRSDPVLQAVEFPARVAHLDAGLAHMDRNHLALQDPNEKTFKKK